MEPTPEQVKIARKVAYRACRRFRDRNSFDDFYNDALFTILRFGNCKYAPYRTFARMYGCRSVEKAWLVQKTVWNHGVVDNRSYTLRRSLTEGWPREARAYAEAKVNDEGIRGFAARLGISYRQAKIVVGEVKLFFRVLKETSLPETRDSLAQK